MTKQVTRKYIWLRKAFKQLRFDFGNTCKVIYLFNDLERLTLLPKTDRECSKKLEFAHLHPTKLVPNGRGRGSYERYKDIMQNPDCYILLCKKHHAMFDNGELKL